MEATVITDLTRTLVADRRYRRSDRVTDSLAFQCAHVQQQLGLEAVVVSDEVGDRWVGSGEKGLCRLLGRSAAEIARGPSSRLDYRVAALQTLRSDLTLGQVTTFRIDLPRSGRHVYVTGVGQGRLRDVGVVNVADGTKRILGVTPGRAPVAPAAPTDPELALNEQIYVRWNTLRDSGALTGDAPVRRLGGFDDRAYAESLASLLAPLEVELGRAGLVADSLWAGWRWRSSEAPLGEGVFVRTLRAPVREVRSGTQVGAAIVDLAHRHDVFDIPVAPHVRLRWA
jgi:hypothetical protein